MTFLCEKTSRLMYQFKHWLLFVYLSKRFLLYIKNKAVTSLNLAVYLSCLFKFGDKVNANHIALFIKPSFSTFLSFKCWHICNSIYNSAPQQRSNAMLFRCGWLAQLGEHRPYKARVTGSSPVSPTTYNLFWIIIIKTLSR